MRIPAAVPKPQLAGHPLDRLLGGLEQALGVEHPLAQQPLQRGRAGDGDEAAGERARAHRGAAGQHLHRERLVEVLEGPVEGDPERVVTSSHIGTGAWMNWAWPPSRWGGTTMRRATALATSAPWSLAHHVEAEVDGGGGAGGGHHVAVDHVEDVGVHVDVGEHRCCRRSAYIQWVVARRPSSRPALAEQERPAAEAEDAGAAGVGGAEGVDQLGARLVVGRPHRDHHGVGPLHVGQPVRGVDGEAHGVFTCMGGGTAAHTRSWYQGSTSSLRSRPKTSQATLSSNGLTPWLTIVATTWGRLLAGVSGHVESMARIMR